MLDGPSSLSVYTLSAPITGSERLPIITALGGIEEGMHSLAIRINTLKSDPTFL